MSPRRLPCVVLLSSLLASARLAGAQPPPEAASPARRVVTLSEAVRLSLSRNPDALTARAEIARAEALVTQARAHWLPTVGAAASYTRINNDRYLGNNLILAQDTVALGAQLAVPILAPVQWAQWSHARNDLRTSRAGGQAVRRAVAIATARSYLGVLTQGRLLAISVLSRDTAKAHYEYAHTRASFGLGNRLNELRALDELRSDEAAVAQAEAAVERAREALGVLTGDSQALDVEDGVLLGELPDEEQVSEARLRERPDLQLVQRRRDAAAAVLDDSWRDYLPYLLGTLSAAYQDPATSTIPAATWQAQLVLSLPLYDGGQRYGARRERRALLQEADIAVERALREARAEVRVAFTNLRSAERALTSARASAGAAHDTLALANLAFGGGAVSNLEVIDAERRRRDADVQAAIAEDGVRQARLDVLAAAGLFPTD